jgi:hypothetical protein
MGKDPVADRCVCESGNLKIRIGRIGATEQVLQRLDVVGDARILMPACRRDSLIDADQNGEHLLCSRVNVRLARGAVL